MYMCAGLLAGWSAFLYMSAKQGYSISPFANVIHFPDTRTHHVRTHTFTTLIRTRTTPDRKCRLWSLNAPNNQGKQVMQAGMARTAHRVSENKF